MKIEYLSDLDARFHVKADRGRRWRLIAPFIFSVDGERFEVPVYFWTDFASIPRLIWPVISPYDLGDGPVPHDFGYFTGLKDKRFWDEVLRACMELDGIPSWKRRAAYRAVDLFGGRTWNNYRKQGQGAEQLARITVRGGGVLA